MGTEMIGWPAPKFTIDGLIPENVRFPLPTPPITCCPARLYCSLFRLIVFKFATFTVPAVAVAGGAPKMAVSALVNVYTMVAILPAAEVVHLTVVPLSQVPFSVPKPAVLLLLSK